MTHAFSDPLPLAERTIGAMVRRAAAVFGDRPFVSWRGRTLSYAEIDREANKVANAFRQLGVGKGTRVGIFAANGLEYLTLWFGLAKIGAIELPLNTAYRAPQIAATLLRAEVPIVVVQANLAGEFARVCNQLTSCKYLITSGGTVKAPPSANVLALEKLVASAPSTDPCAEVLATDIVAIMNTSGTTGPAKGVLLPHGQQYWLARNMVRALALKEDDVFYNFFPFFHNTAQAMITLPVLLTGGRMVMTDKFSVSAFWPDVEAHGVTVFYYIGEILHLLVEAGGNPVRSRLRAGWGLGGSPRDVVRFEERYGVKLGTGYGSTEGNVPVFRPLGSNPTSAAAGKVLPEFEVCVADSAATCLPAGEVGEILIKSNEPATMMVGYDGNHAASLEAFRGGWYHTGDAGYFDGEDNLYFVARIKDVIRVRGENVSAFEVEEVLLSYPGVLEAAAIAVPGEIGGDDIKAAIVPVNGTKIDLAALLDHCSELLPKYSVPRYIELYDALPKTATNKVQKNVLRERAFTPQTWDAVKKAMSAKSPPEK
jgi:carnitine-CoA ligase